MWIGVARIVMDFHGNLDVAGKRRQLEELCREIRGEFNVSALEIADADDPERCVIGLAAVMPEGWRESAARSLIQKICERVDSTSFARVVVEDWDLLSH